MAYDPDYNPTSKEAAVDLCRELGIDPEKFWGVVNDFACDAYFDGQVDIMQNGPAHLAQGKRMSKDRAIDWIGEVYEPGPMDTPLGKHIG